MTSSDVDLGMGTDPSLIELADIMVESAIGYAGVPLAVCRGLLVDGNTIDVPLATEEPSVVAAVNYAAGIVSRHGGFTTHATDPITTGQIYLERTDKKVRERILSAEDEIRAALKPILARMEQRGGGYRGMDALYLPGPELLRVQIHVDVRDSMGANLVNSAVEHVAPLLESITGGRRLMAILTNNAERRLATARFEIPVSSLTRGEIPGSEMARRIELASRLAQEDPDRAVTHNKGVMNGITALMLASCNDIRAVEAAVHSFAGRSGTYRGITQYGVGDELLRGELEAPLPVGTVGGATGIHPTSRLALAMLGNPTSTGLARIAAAVGLAQNLAAVSALTAEGIQSGHMTLHARRTEWIKRRGSKS